MKTKIKVNDEVIELTDMCHWDVVNGVLQNLNTKHDEGVTGDIITYTNGGIKYRGHVVGYTCYQFVATEEWGKVILSAAEYDAEFIHNTPVELIECGDYEEEPEPKETKIKL
jgi:hypothetical protein